MSEATFPLVPSGTSGGGTTSTEDKGGKVIGSGLTDEVGEPSGRIDDHCADALTYLLYRYKGKPRLSDFLCTLGDQATDLELAFWDLFTKRTLDAAEGIQLDGIGRIVGEPRKDRADDVYRIFLRVRIAVNRSDGRVDDDLYPIMRLAFGDDAAVAITEHYPMALQVTLLEDIGDVSPADFILYLRQAKAGSVRLDFVYTVEAQADTLTWDSSESGQTWGSTTDPAIGGVWAGVAT